MAMGQFIIAPGVFLAIEEVVQVATTGVAILDFGSTPAETAQVTITGQAGIIADSRMEVWFERAATGDNNADQHDQLSMLFDLTPGDIVAGTGFTIKARTRFGFKATGTFEVPWVWS
jgi:hypothetical protein